MILRGSIFAFLLNILNMLQYYAFVLWCILVSTNQGLTFSRETAKKHAVLKVSLSDQT